MIERVVQIFLLLLCCMLRREDFFDKSASSDVYANKSKTSL